VSDRQVYNPLATGNLGRSVATALLESPLERLDQVKRFRGAGIYALYYAGEFAPYRPIAIKTREANERIDPKEGARPIYVGKAVPEGKRKGKGTVKDADGGTTLFGRVTTHRNSIKAAVSTLRVEDFYCQCLVVDPLFITLGESLMIAWFSPLWNQKLDGFGNNAPGSGREKGKRSRWDTVHAGRKAAMRVAERDETAEQLLEEVRQYLAENTGPRKPVDVSELKVAEPSPEDSYTSEADREPKASKKTRKR